MRLLAGLFFAFVALAAERVDTIISAGYVLPMSADMRVIPNGAVAVKGGVIVAIGPAAEIKATYTAKQTLRRPNAVLLPGFVNTHTHAAMSLLRGIADDQRLQDWLERYIFPAEGKHVNPEFVYQGTRLACLEMIFSGITTFTDMYYFEERVAEAAKEAGLRGVLGQTVIRFPVGDAKTPQDALARAEAFFRKYGDDPLVTPALAPHAIYTLDKPTLQACRQLASKYRVPLLIHLSETKKEVDDSRALHGASPVQMLNDWGIFDGPVLAAHAVWLSAEDIAILKAKKVGVAHCPSSNMKLASGIAPVPALRSAGIPVGLGSDGPAGSNNDFDLLEEADLAGKLQKVNTMDPRSLPARDLLRMATIEGATALGMERRIGSLEAGKLADMITLDLNQPHAWPHYDLFAQVVYASKSADVRDVMVNGRWLLRDRVPLTLKPQELRQQSILWRDRIRTSLNLPQ
jgi:5-methylthioadenosine/S-adenosylhomocysteine deaminase